MTPSTRLESVRRQIAATIQHAMADVLAGLTTADGGEAWLQHQLARLDTAEEPLSG